MVDRSCSVSTRGKCRHSYAWKSALAGASKYLPEYELRRYTSSSQSSHCEGHGRSIISSLVFHRSPPNYLPIQCKCTNGGKRMDEFACDSRACALLQNLGYTADSGYISTAPLPTCFRKSGSYSCCGSK
ncbi:hypothetical protein BDR03DRAFT_968603 [Suillus americanus]|nr:hypothetical protein BDR03DRAFT_968603 [Suillus americanus]